MKKVLTSLAVGLVLTSGFSGGNAHAEEVNTEVEVNSGIEVYAEAEGADVSLSDVSDTSAGNTLAKSSGIARLSGNNPFGLRPRAKSSTEAKSGSASELKAKTDVNNNGTSASSTGWVSLTNTTKVATPTLVASTEKAHFVGHHQIKKSSTTSWEVIKDTDLKF